MSSKIMNGYMSHQDETTWSNSSWCTIMIVIMVSVLNWDNGYECTIIIVIMVSVMDLRSSVLVVCIYIKLVYIISSRQWTPHKYTFIQLNHSIHFCMYLLVHSNSLRYLQGRQRLKSDEEKTALAQIKYMLAAIMIFFFWVHKMVIFLH